MDSMRHYEPLVKINTLEQNGFTISDIVNQRAYHAAFEKMPLSSAVSNEAYRQAGRILQKADGQNKEYLVAIDAKTGALVTDNLDRDGVRQTTTFKGKELDLLNEHDGNVITIHNHPHSLAPSYGDIITASRNKAVSGGIVVGHDGSVWYYSASSTKIADKLESAYNALKETVGDNAELAALGNLVKRARKEGLIWQQLR